MRLNTNNQNHDDNEHTHDNDNSPPGTAPLLRAGVKLSERYRTALPKAGVGSVWIEDGLSEGIVVVEPLRLEFCARVHRATGEALVAAGSALRDGSGMSRTVMD